MNILIMGSAGMLGHTLLRVLATRPELTVYATSRTHEGLDCKATLSAQGRFYPRVNACDFDSVLRVFSETRPDVVINCIGIIKQLAEANDPIITLSINSLFPHRLALACGAIGARMIHISTDCVFRGDKGNYVESVPSDATDLYGRTKFLGEVNCPHCVTLRTSIIGHEMRGGHGLIDWFLGQSGTVKGYVNAIYSGFPTIEMARIIADHVIPNQGLSGLFHVASDPISKYELLRLVADTYGHHIQIEQDYSVCCDRSLNGERFTTASGYKAPSWQKMIRNMWRNYKEYYCV